MRRERRERGGRERRERERERERRENERFLISLYIGPKKKTNRIW
jgi:hypothetical protein